MKKSLLLLAAATTASGCMYTVDTPDPEGVGSFQVKVVGVTGLSADGSTTQALEVVPSCEGEPGTDKCRYHIPRGPVELRLEVTALDKAGQPYEGFSGPVAFRTVPGEFAGDYAYRWTQVTNGKGTGTLRAQYLYGEVRAWAADEPIEPDYADGKVVGQLPPEPGSRSFASGSSAPLFFEEPTLASIQQPHNGDNRSSPFVGQFVTIGRAPESGAVLYQNCRDEVPRPVTLLVTGTDPSGFFVTDITACRVPDLASPVREPSGNLPGSFGSVFVYNYNFPEGLDTGDLLWTLAGSIQEFTSTSQLTFPSWTVRERVRLQSPEQWDKYLKLHPPVELNLRHCYVKNELTVSNVDELCGYYNDNLKLESLESALVKVRNVRFPRVFKNCDLDGNGSVPFFCSSRGAWTYCGGSNTPPPPDVAEVQCNYECTTGSGPFKGTICSERSQFNGFGQFVVEMAGPGPAEAGLDDSLEGRIQSLPLSSSTTPVRTTVPYDEGEEVRIWCEADAHYRLGGGSVTATNQDELLPARTRLDVTVTGEQSHVAFLATAEPADPNAPPRCHVARNTRTRLLLTTKDAVPELRPDCDENDADAERARQCRLQHAATFDVVGHLRQIQPGRPRWMVMPRDAEDLCCHPGPGQTECPRPIKPCQ